MKLARKQKLRLESLEATKANHTDVEEWEYRQLFLRTLLKPGEVTSPKKSYKETQYGFQWGPMLIERACSDDEKGWVCLRLKTMKHEIQVNVTKSGKIRMFEHTGTKWLEWKTKK